MKLSNDSPIDLSATPLVLDGSEVPFRSLDQLRALLPSYGKEGADSPMRAAVLAAFMAMLNYAWFRIGMWLAAQKTPRFAFGVLLDEWGDLLRRPRAAGEIDGPYMARLLSGVDMITPAAIKTAVNSVVAEFSNVAPAYIEPAVDAAFASPVNGCPWAAFAQSSSKRLWAQDPTSPNPTAGAYVVPVINAQSMLNQFWVVLAGDAGDDSLAPHSMDTVGAEATDPIDYLGAAPDAWTAKPAMASRTSVSAVRMLDGRILIAGGLSSTPTVLSSCQIYDPATDTFSAAASMTTARWGHAMVVMPNGHVLAIAGATATDGSVVTNLCEMYDPQSDTWVAAGNLGLSRMGVAAFLLNDGRVVAICGKDGAGTARSVVDFYDPIGGSWFTDSGTSSPRKNFVAVKLKSGRILVAGGINDVGTTLQSAEIYTPSPIGIGGTWATVASMAVTRSDAVAARLSSGRVLVAGGVAGASYRAQTEVYDEYDNAWYSVASMSQARALSAIALNGEGDPLVIGGNNGSSVATVERFDAKTYSWKSAAALGTARDTAAAIALGGDVLVFGGTGASTSVERFSPILIDYNYVPTRPDSLMDRIRSEIEQRKGFGVTWFAFIDPLLASAL